MVVDGADDTRLTCVANETGYHLYHERDSFWTLSETLITAIAAIRDSDPTKTPIRLADAIDPDALDAIFSDTYDGNERSSGYVVFEVAGLCVFAHANGHIFIRERTTTDDETRKR